MDHLIQYTCDACGQSILHKSQGGYFPPGWSIKRIECKLYCLCKRCVTDYNAQGISLELCERLASKLDRWGQPLPPELGDLLGGDKAPPLSLCARGPVRAQAVIRDSHYPRAVIITTLFLLGALVTYSAHAVISRLRFS